MSKEISKNHGTYGVKPPRPDSPHNNRKSSAIPHNTNGDGFSAHHGAAGGHVTQHDDLHEHVKAANSEARARYNATHRYPISGGL